MEDDRRKVRRGIVILPRKGGAMNDYSPRQERATRVVIAFVALLVSLPLLVGAAYDLASPQSVAVGDYFLPDYEQFKIDRYEKMSNRDLAFSGLRDEAEMRRVYDKIAGDHRALVTEQTRRRLFMYGTLFVASLSYLLYAWREYRVEARRTSGVGG
ncbi:MAG: hypothetical protein ACJ74Q_06195 [Pyrinomonadaceae bacterium]